MVSTFVVYICFFLILCIFPIYGKDGKTSINRVASLTNLQLITSDGLDQGLIFDPNTLAYPVNIPNQIPTATIIASATAPVQLSMNVNNRQAIPLTANVASDPIQLSQTGTTLIHVQSVSADSKNSIIYVVQVYQSSGTNTALVSLTVNMPPNDTLIMMDPPFNPTIYSYTLTVPNDVTQIAMDAVCVSPTVKEFVMLNGNEMATMTAESPTGTIELPPDRNVQLQLLLVQPQNQARSQTVLSIVRPGQLTLDTGLGESNHKFFRAPHIESGAERMRESPLFIVILVILGLVVGVSIPMSYLKIKKWRSDKSQLAGLATGN